MFSITLINGADGNVHGHKAGCADIAREAAKFFSDEPWTFEVETKRDAFLEYNADFIAEGGEENGWPIEWKACANHVPADASSIKPSKSNSKTNRKEPVMAQNVTTIPGLFDNDMAFISESDGMYAVAVNKTLVVTDSLDEAQEWFGETSYTVATDSVSIESDEVMSLEDAALESSGALRAVQEVAQMVLIAGEPGPRAVKFLERVVADDKFASTVVRKVTGKVAA